MQCPVDGTTLVMSDRQGIEIDYCPQCRGVWLDRGEIDKIVERSVGMGPAQHTSTPRVQDDRQQHREYDDDDRHHGSYDHRSQQHHKKESWFGELFD